MGVKPSATDSDANNRVGVKNTIANETILVTITSSASDESAKTFTVVGTGMDGSSLTEIITGPEAKNDASFKTGTTLIQDGYAYFKFDVFYKKLKNKGWRYQEDKTGSMMLKIYKDCEIDFLDQKI